MTLGHRYLIEEAAKRCDFLYLLVVSEDKSAVPAGDRRAIVAEATADLPHVAVAGDGPLPGLIGHLPRLLSQGEVCCRGSVDGPGYRRVFEAGCRSGYYPPVCGQ